MKEKSIIDDLLQDDNTKNGKSDTQLTPEEYDRDFKRRDREHLQKHNASYTQMLNDYESYINQTLGFKKKYREHIVIFFL